MEQALRLCGEVMTLLLDQAIPDENVRAEIFQLYTATCGSFRLDYWRPSCSAPSFRTNRCSKPLNTCASATNLLDREQLRLLDEDFPKNPHLQLCDGELHLDQI